MKLRRISCKNFKCLYDMSFEPGKVNVFVGANGAGKTTVLEAIGLLSAAMTDRVDSASLQRRGIRLSVPSLYKSNFKKSPKQQPAISLSLEWENADGGDIFQYDVQLTPAGGDYWKYLAETLKVNDETKWERTNISPRPTNNHIGFFLIDGDEGLKESRKIAQDFSAYGIFQPNTMTLRGTIPDPNQIAPIGLNGGRLAEAIDTLIQKKDGDCFFGDLYMEDVFEMIDWVSDITVGKPKKKTINANIPTTRQVIQFAYRYMRDSVQFTAYDASEGALYVLFMLALAMHLQTPTVFAVDSFDHALNPRLAKKMIQVFCEQIIQHNKYVFLTTHNPLVLDGLDICNDDIRLFTVDRDSDGCAQIQRILVSKELLSEGQPLSRLWVNGRLGGVPILL